MTEQLEDLLRDAFIRLAEEASPAANLAGTVRAALRRRRQRLARITVATAAAVAVLGLGGAIAWGPLQSAQAPSAGRGGTATIAPQPAPSDPCPDGSTCEAEKVVPPLRRPLHLPRLAAGAPCPVSPSRELPQGGGFSGPFTAAGSGPVYMPSGTITFDYPPKRGSSYYRMSWGGQKVIWAIDKAYAGPLLFRGKRIDGPQQLRFDHYLGAYGDDYRDGQAYAELAYPPQPDGVRVMRTPPSAVRLRAPGCYAIQVDGTNFSEILVFRARLDPS